MIQLELLAPARTADIGIQAILHGADAVYIGASDFGARQAAGNSLDEIARLVDFAHQFHCKVYVTVNTIIYETELGSAEKLINGLYEIGVDALIVQDMGISRLNIPPIPLHASTQMDNRSGEKVEALAALGYEQVVLARELSLAEISDIHLRCPSTKLEVFVHGALCVSLSGRCYASQALFGRSANRGECAQLCRMAFNLENERGDILLHDKHLLSLKDMCRIDCLEELCEAGASSFKIEGRLKDMSYVKNVTAAYSIALDNLIEKYPDRYERSSKGRIHLKFQPDVEKSFNRGFTHYLLHGYKEGLAAFDTPKSMGKYVGRIKEVYTDSFVVDTVKGTDTTFSNGDGICCFSENGELIGFRINRTEGNRLYPHKQSRKIRRGMKLYRNFDKHFEDLLSAESSDRRIPVEMRLDHTSEGFSLSVSDGDYTFTRTFQFQAELARSPQHDNISRQLSKLGNTPLTLDKLHIDYKQNYFIPSSLLAQWRRAIVEAYIDNARSEMLDIRSAAYNRRKGSSSVSLSELTSDQQIFGMSEDSSPKDHIGYQFNVSNSLAKAVYMDLGAKTVEPAFEIEPKQDAILMTCRHCIRFALGWCAIRQKADMKKMNEKLYLRMQNGTRLQLDFNCRECMMSVRL